MIDERPADVAQDGFIDVVGERLDPAAILINKQPKRTLPDAVEKEVQVPSGTPKASVSRREDAFDVLGCPVWISGRQGRNHRPSAGMRPARTPPARRPKAAATDGESPADAGSLGSQRSGIASF
jgi:hypothetical protein